MAEDNLIKDNLYSCQICQALIETEEELEIIIGFDTPFISPLCSRKCKFKLFYRILIKCLNLFLKEMWDMEVKRNDQNIKFI